MTLRRRLSLLYMAATAVLLLASALTAVLFFQRGLRTLADRKLLAAVDEAAGLLQSPGPLGPEAARSRLGRFAEGLDGFYVFLRGADGTQLYGSDPQLGAAWPASAAAYPQEKAVFASRTLPSGERLRTVSLGLPAPRGALLQLGLPVPSPLAALSADSWYLLAALSLLLLAGAGWAGWAIAGRALAPIDRIAEVARKAGEGALNGRIPRHAGEDELGRLIDVLNGMLASIEAYSIKLKQFASNVTHQLKTPLTVMRGQTEVALLGKPGREEAVAVLESNLAELETMTRVVEDILEYSRLDSRESGTARAQRLDKLVSAVARKAAVLAMPKSLKIETALAEATAAVQAGKLEQALLNVIDNAVRHTPAGGRITLSVSVEGGTAVVAVADSGPGVAEAELPRLFERGYSTSGSGLGLGLARAMLESFGGRIEASSPPGSGLRVRILLPAAPQNLPASPTE